MNNPNPPNPPTPPRRYKCERGHRFAVVTEAGLPPLAYCPGCGRVEFVHEEEPK